MEWSGARNNSNILHYLKGVDPMQDPVEVGREVSRREFLRGSGIGLGAIALGHLLHGDGYAAAASPAWPARCGWSRAWRCLGRRTSSGCPTTTR